MTKTFTGEEFLKALSEGNLREPIGKTGMVKPAADGTPAIQFAEGTACGQWTTIPAEMIEKVEFLRTVPCRDHQHPLVRLFLKEPPASNPLATVFAELVRNSPQPASRPTTLPQPSHRPAGIAPRILGSQPGLRTRLARGPFVHMAEFAGTWCYAASHCSDGRFSSGQGEDCGEALLNSEYGCYPAQVLSSVCNYCE